MTEFAIVDKAESAKLSRNVFTSVDLHLEMGMREVQGKVLIWWSLPDSWIMCPDVTVNIYDFNRKWVKGWTVSPKHSGEILTEFDWGTGWSANLFVRTPFHGEREVMWTEKINDEDN